MRSTRVAKKQMKKNYIINLLIVFLVVIPLGAVGGSYLLHDAFASPAGFQKETVALDQQSETAFKYHIDMTAKQLYRVDIKKFEGYEAAESYLEKMKKNKLNGFILKENGYVVTYGMFSNESQAKTAVQYLSRKHIEAAASLMDINSMNLQYGEDDKKLMELLSAIDGAVVKLINEKSALSIEGLYSNKEIAGQGLENAVKLEEQLSKYLNYLKDIKTTEENSELKSRLEKLAKEILIDQLPPEGSYDYYKLQNSLMNQVEALKKFYETLSV